MVIDVAASIIGNAKLSKAATAPFWIPSTVDAARFNFSSAIGGSLLYHCPASRAFHSPKRYVNRDARNEAHPNIGGKFAAFPECANPRILRLPLQPDLKV